MIDLVHRLLHDHQTKLLLRRVLPHIKCDRGYDDQTFDNQLIVRANTDKGQTVVNESKDDNPH